MVKWRFLLGAGLALCVCSCADKIQRYMDDPKTLLEDPVSVGHQKALDDLETRFLHKEITYAQYLEQKQTLEDDYTRKVEKRQNIIEGE